jgi:hypothetical protein
MESQGVVSKTTPAERITGKVGEGRHADNRSWIKMPDSGKWLRVGPTPELVAMIHEAATRIRRRFHAEAPGQFPAPEALGAMESLQHVIIEKNRWLELEALAAAQTEDEWVNLKTAALRLKKTPDAFRVWFRRHGAASWRRRTAAGWTYNIGAIASHIFFDKPI